MQTLRLLPSELLPGDLVDLHLRDQTPANGTIWEHELAEVQSVSTKDAPSGGWADDLADRTTAVIYTNNGASPSLVRSTVRARLQVQRPAKD
jgi:hypothetical protein